MFSNRVANSANFLQMPAESQLLFFHMVLRADDDGIVEAYPVLKLLGVAPDSFKVLLAKGYLKQLNEDQVVVISDWLEHNTIRSDRKVNSIHLPLLLERFPDTQIVVVKPRSDVIDNSNRVDSPRTAEGKLSKDKLLTGENKFSQEIEIVSEDEKPPKEKKDTTYFKVFQLWGADYPLSWRGDKTQVAAAKNLLQETQLEEMQKMLALYAKLKEIPFCPEILKPSDLDRKWDNLLSFRKKHG